VLKTRIAILASGSGSNAQKIMEHFKNHADSEVVLVLTNNPQAYVLQRADNFEIPTHVFSRQEFFQTDDVVKILKKMNVDLIVLAGFLWLIPESLLKAFPNQIINIHPSLLPKYGGKGMYGDNVHQAVLENGETESGITIHFVNEHFDEGEMIHQAKFKIEPGDDLNTIKLKGQQLEHQHFPKVVEALAAKLRGKLNA
jgi:phosphoribosylglycinamide formyltransferase-1